MKPLVLYTISLLLLLQVSAQTRNSLTPVANALFKEVRTRITDPDKNSVAALLGFVMSGSKEGVFAQDAGSREFPFNATLYPVDLNNDGREEIVVNWGNSYTSGNTGMSVTLFIKNASGKYVSQLGFPGTLPDVLAVGYKGFPDLLIGGAGMEFPVYRWNGKAYVLHRTVRDAEYGKLKMTSLEEMSRKYQENIR